MSGDAQDPPSCPARSITFKILPYVDIMFGNRSEFDVFINTVEAKLETSSLIIKNLRAMITGEGVENLEMKIENICETPVRSKPRSLIVVVTEGCQPVQCYTIGEKLRTVSVPVPSLDKTYIKVRPNTSSSPD